MDNLLRPCADIGIQADPLIEWKYDVEKQVSLPLYYKTAFFTAHVPL